MNRPIRVLLVEDDDDFAFLTGQMLQEEPELELAGRAASRQEAVELARALRPQLTLMDLTLSPGQMDGIDAARAIRLDTDAKVILLSVYEDPKIVLEASRRSFASAYLFKSQFGLIPDTLRAVARSHSPQEPMILSLILGQLSTAEQSVFRRMLGENVPLSSAPKTIANQQSAVLRKLGLHSKEELLHVFAAYQF